MMDKETYKREIVRMWDSLRDDKYKGTETCAGITHCGECPLINNTTRCGESSNAFEMIEIVEKWSREHPQKHKISQLEYDILKHLSDNTKHIYITRDEYNYVYLFDEEPKKSNGHWYGRGACSVSVFNDLFQFVKWEDEEPTSIQEVLKKM